ncbi:hypothetical protein [Nostocoides veronense]|uniref:hypothetical protein n=1 Tax=Nostocoides veronense TaxID=330836 RepID=UPI0031D57A1D
MSGRLGRSRRTATAFWAGLMRSVAALKAAPMSTAMAMKYSQISSTIGVDNGP